MSEWQPIETAPKDGTRVLLAGGQYDTSHWEEGSGPAVCHFEPYDGWIITRYDTQIAAVSYCAPTHWMPLPEPPQ